MARAPPVLDLTRYVDKVSAPTSAGAPRERVGGSQQTKRADRAKAHSVSGLPCLVLVACAPCSPQEVRVKFTGGREVTGVLKGFDKLLNLVLDDTKEFLKDPEDPYKLLDETRPLGLTVCRGTTVMLICPAEGFEEIANPFLEQEAE